MNDHTRLDIGKVVWRFLAAFILYILLLAGLLWWHGVPVHAHSWYDPDCCAEKDCEPIDATLSLTGPDGKQYYTTKLGSYPVGPNTKIRPSKDSLTHACIWMNQLWCLYIPGGM